VNASRTGLIALVLWASALAISGVSAVLLIASISTPVPDIWGFRGFTIPIALSFATVGAIVARRQPANAIGWFFCVGGLLAAVQGFIEEYVITGVLAAPGSLPATTELAWIEAWLWVPWVGVLATFLPLLFPSGGLPSPRWRPMVPFAAVVTGLVTVCFAIAPGPLNNTSFIDNPYGLPEVSVTTFSSVGFPIAFVPFLAATALCVASLFARYRASAGEARQQIKWVAFALAILGAALVAQVVAVGGSLAAIAKPVQFGLVTAVVAVPIAAGMAILRYRLYDVDRVISRTVAYALLTAVLAGSYALGILVLESLLSTLAGGDTLAVAASTLAAFALFQPVSRRIRIAVDRRFDRSRYDAARIVEAFAQRLRDQVDVDRLRDELIATLHATVAPSQVQVWLRDRPGAVEQALPDVVPLSRSSGDRAG
jgi:hypothetical protein